MWPGGREAGVGGPCEEGVPRGRNGLSLLSQHLEKDHGEGQRGESGREAFEGKLATGV